MPPLANIIHRPHGTGRRHWYPNHYKNNYGLKSYVQKYAYKAPFCRLMANKVMLLISLRVRFAALTRIIEKQKLPAVIENRYLEQILNVPLPQKALIAFFKLWLYRFARNSFTFDVCHWTSSGVCCFSPTPFQYICIC